jgi:hypothetical protein
MLAIKSCQKLTILHSLLVILSDFRLVAQASNNTLINLVLLLFFIGQLSVPGMVRPIH